MNIAEMLYEYDQIILESERNNNGAGIRLFTVYKNTAFYLIDNGKLKIMDEESEFLKFIGQYTTAALYKVAEHYRKTTGLPPLNFEQLTYHDKRMTRAEYGAGGCHDEIA